MEENDQEFLRALHEEKIRTQNERAKLVTMKLAFITVLFGLISVKMKIEDGRYFLADLLCSSGVHQLRSLYHVCRFSDQANRDLFGQASGLPGGKGGTGVGVLLHLLSRQPGGLFCQYVLLRIVLHSAQQLLSTPSRPGLRNLCGYGLRYGWSCLWPLSLPCG